MINLMYACNDNFFKGVALSLISIAKNTKEALNVYVLTIDLSDINPKYITVDENKRITLENKLKEYNSESKICTIDLKNEYMNLFSGSSVEKNKYSPYAFLRLLSSSLDILPDKVLYIDSDILALGDIKELYDIDMSEYEYAMCRDQVGRWMLGRNYCNSGVLLINMARVKKSKRFIDCQNYILSHHSSMPDQDALNFCSDKILILDPKFNEQIKPKNNTVLFHFCQKSYFFPYIHFRNIKQWEVEKVHSIYKLHQFDDTYEIYESIKSVIEA